MHYKGKNKHSQEELEEIIDELLDQSSESRIDDSFDAPLLKNMSDLVRELYYSCDVKPDEEDKAVDICKNLKRALQEFGRDNNFMLSQRKK